MNYYEVGAKLVFKSASEVRSELRGQEVEIVSMSGLYCRFTVLTGELIGRNYVIEKEDMDRRFRVKILNKGRWIF